MAKLIYKKNFDAYATLNTIQRGERLVIPYGNQSLSGLRSIISRHFNANEKEYSTSEVPEGLLIVRN